MIKFDEKAKGRSQRKERVKSDKKNFPKILTNCTYFLANIDLNNKKRARRKRDGIMYDKHYH